MDCMALYKWIQWLYFHGLGGSATMEYSILLKLELYIQMAMFCVYTFTKTGFNYLSGIICIILYVISQRMDLISFINPFSISPSLSVLSGCGMQNWLNSICICAVFIFVLLFINYVSVRQKDKMSL